MYGQAATLVAEQVLCEVGEGVVGNLPEVAVGVGEVGGVAAPEDFLGVLDQGCAGVDGVVDYGVYFFFGGYVVGQGDHGGAGGGEVYAGGFVGELGAGVEG